LGNVARVVIYSGLTVYPTHRIGWGLWLIAQQFVTHGQALAAPGAAGIQNTATIFGGHARAKTMFVFAAAVAGLKGAFHRFYSSLTRRGVSGMQI